MAAGMKRKLSSSSLGPGCDNSLASYELHCDKRAAVSPCDAAPADTETGDRDEKEWKLSLLLKRWGFSTHRGSLSWTPRSSRDSETCRPAACYSLRAAEAAL